MLKVAFTLCSNNYLAKAKVVADSFISKHPDYQFYFFLVDKKDLELDYSNLAKYAVIEIQEVVNNIEELSWKYDIVELNTAVKPAAFRYLFGKENFNLAIYLDPDLMIFDRFAEIEELLAFHENNVVITPHFCSPIDDGKYPSEVNFTLFGLYNLGFIAIKNSEESHRFLLWWHDRLMKYCYFLPEKGMFTDQLWINYAPIFFNGVFLLKHLGYNVANWNLYERVISEKHNMFYVNGEYPLKFFHFSHYQYENPYAISKHQNRHCIADRPDVKLLIDQYQAALESNHHVKFAKISCHYNELYMANKQQLKLEAEREYYTFKRKVINKVTRILNRLIPG